MLLLQAPLPSLSPILQAEWLLARLGPCASVILRGGERADAELAEALLQRLPAGARLEDLPAEGGLPQALASARRPVVAIAPPCRLRSVIESLPAELAELRPGSACCLRRDERGVWSLAWQAAPSFAAPQGAASGAQQ